jgi:hypothetical protein
MSQPPPGPMVTYNCAADTRGETFTPGLEKMGSTQAFDYKLMSVDPAPPSRGDNTWVVQISQMSNNVVAGPATNLADTMTVTPFMPDHQHGSPIEVQISEDPANPGSYTFDPVNLWMPGVWETTIAIPNSAGALDKAKYTFCLAE